MTLPTSRERTYTTATPVKANDLNAIQDCIIGSKHPERSEAHSAFEMKTYSTDWSPNSNGYLQTTVMTVGQLPIPLPFGTRLIDTVYVMAYGDGAVDCTYTVYLVDDTMTKNAIGTFTDTNRAAAWGTVEIPITSAQAPGAGESIYVEVDVNGAGYRVGNWWFVTDRL